MGWGVDFSTPDRENPNPNPEPAVSMHAVAPLVPVLPPVGNGHDRHEVLYKLFRSINDADGSSVATACVLAHAAMVLLSCECEEGGRLRVAVRMWAGCDANDKVAIDCRGLSSPPRLTGRPGRVFAASQFDRMPGEKHRLKDGRRAWLKSTRRVEVGALAVLYLAGWPEEVTGFRPDRGMM